MLLRSKEEAISHAQRFQNAVANVVVKTATGNDFYNSTQCMHAWIAVRESLTWRVFQGQLPGSFNHVRKPFRQAYRLARRRTPPRATIDLYVPLLKVENARQGFLSRADFEAIKSNIPDLDVRDFIEWAFWTGMRKGEIAKLTWDMLDRETWTLRLHARAAKTGKGRALTLAGPLREIIERRDAARRLDCPLIFHRKSKGKLGQPVKEFRKMWNAACRAANIQPGRAGGLTFHDTRRTAVRNMRKAGIHETVAMSISGRKTRSMFDRYNIVDEDDQREAFERLDGYVSSLPTERKVLSFKGGQNTDNSPPAKKKPPRKQGWIGGSAWESNPPKALEARQSRAKGGKRMSHLAGSAFASFSLV